MKITFPECQIEGSIDEFMLLLDRFGLHDAANGMIREIEAYKQQNEQPEPEPVLDLFKPDPEPTPEPKPKRKKHVPTGEKAPKPVELRKDGGTWTRYESKREAAEAIGVRGTDVSRAVKTGWLVNGYEARAAGKEKVQPKHGYSTCGKPREVDVKVADEWLTFDSLTDAARFIGCGPNNLQTGMAKGHYKGFEVRYHVDDSGKANPELDAMLAEIESNNRKPYEISKKI